MLFCEVKKNKKMNLILSTVFSGIFMMFIGFLVKKQSYLNSIAALLFAGIIGSAVLQLNHIAILPDAFKNMLWINDYGIQFFIILAFATLFYIVLNHEEFEKVNENYTQDYYALLFFVFTGIALLALFSNLVIMFLGVEILSIPMYILAGSKKDKMKSTEASIKYFLMGAFSTGLLLMGITLLYGATGSFDYDHLSIVSVKGFEHIYFFGWILLILSFCFKISLAPFHFWAPDVYDGTPTVFTSFMSTIVKGAAFLGFVQILSAFPSTHPLAENYRFLIGIIILLTLLIGNFSAIAQQSVKRMMAYSSIVQAGFMMFIALQLSENSKNALLFYVLSYSLAGISIFYTLTKIKKLNYENFNGFAKNNPFLAFTTTVSLISLAGIPLTSGFIAKFSVLSSVIDNPKNISLLIIALVLAVLSIYYYFKVIIAMYFKNETSNEVIRVSILSKITLILTITLIIILGIFPNTLEFIFS